MKGLSFCRPRTCGPIYFCQHTLGWWRDLEILPGAINRCNRCRLRHFMWELLQESNRRSLFCRLRNPIPGPGPLKDQKLPVVGFVRCFELEPLTMVKLEAIARPARQMESICSTESAFRHMVFTCFQCNFLVLSQFFWPGMFPHLLSEFH